MNLHDGSELFSQEGHSGKIGIRRQDHELLTPKTCQEIDTSNVLYKNLRQFSQDLIAGLMPEGIIHLLKIVDVDQGERKCVRIPMATLDLEFEHFVELSPVINSGEKIPRGFVLFFGDVDQDHLNDSLILHLHVRSRQFEVSITNLDCGLFNSPLRNQ